MGAPENGEFTLSDSLIAKIDALLPTLAEMIAAHVKPLAGDERISCVLVIGCKSDAGGTYFRTAANCPDDVAVHALEYVAENYGEPVSRLYHKTGERQ